MKEIATLISHKIRVMAILGLLLGIGFHSLAKSENEVKHLPVFDILVPTMKVNPAWASPMCPWFLSNMACADPNENAGFSINLDCVDPLMPAKSDEEIQEEVIKRIKNFNMTMLAIGDDEILLNWVKSAPPGRVIPGIGIGVTSGMTVEAFRDSLGNSFFLEDILFNNAVRFFRMNKDQFDWPEGKQ
jgi:hypothetical protein